ncbi:MAG: DUF805 domain-containing protein [Rubinisphaera brasiliensis]|uniref:DUF805 domain-containing protein n=1 Tax=Rubinisphaera brasiliensis TaxID=119 RepID=UPI00391878EB
MLRHYEKAIRNSFNFHGRAPREEFFVLIWSPLMLVFLLVAFPFNEDFVGQLIEKVLVGLVILLLIPIPCATVRRMHDIGSSGWWILVGLVPIIGPILLLVLLLIDSVPLDLPYGPNPKNKYPDVPDEYLRPPGTEPE